MALLYGSGDGRGRARCGRPESTSPARDRFHLQSRLSGPGDDARPRASPLPPDKSAAVPRAGAAAKRPLVHLRDSRQNDVAVDSDRALVGSLLAAMRPTGYNGSVDNFLCREIDIPFRKRQRRRITGIVSDLWRSGKIFYRHVRR
ncbi:hypothetical protein EVAR_60984_1 [Eumeta japonica]|uniref:Uncharacterized protein n=1 Tax=Eumeta variegata TaxID=151549 RepID=A0A4C1XXF9_EUMVA|nr:hypothetical protein EVAR_60984_1 [Eumeta japonica]